MRLHPFAPLLILVVVAGGCRAFPGHPVLGSQPRLAGDAVREAVHAAEPGDTPDEEAAALLFRGLEGVLGPLVELLRAEVPVGRTPRLARLTSMERAVAERYRRGGPGGSVRSVAVMAVVGRMPIPPKEAADLIVDAQVERAVLGADALWPLEVVYALPDAQRARYRASLLGRGAGPLRYDLKFSFAMERVATTDGRVYLRYDPDLAPRPEHVTLFRGGCLLEPDAGGTRVAEILILGTDIQLLPFLQGELEGLVLKTMRDRATNLWIRAWGGR